MPTRVFRRTPTTEEAASYGYKDMLKDAVGVAVRGRADASRRLLAGKPTNADLMELAFAGVGGGTKIARGLGKGKFPFNLKTTDVPLWDNALKRPARTLEARGVRRNIEFMSKEEYFNKLYEGRGLSEIEETRLINPEVVKNYVNAMRGGAKFPMPALETRGGKFTQEGRHRMLAAEELGIDRVPVLTMKSLSEKQKLIERFSKEGLHYDAFTEPLPGYGYHQWTLYGEGPAKGATFGTKGIELGEMEGKIADLVRKFTK